MVHAHTHHTRMSLPASGRSEPTRLPSRPGQFFDGAIHLLPGADARSVHGRLKIAHAATKTRLRDMVRDSRPISLALMQEKEAHTRTCPLSSDKTKQRRGNYSSRPRANMPSRGITCYSREIVAPPGGRGGYSPEPLRATKYQKQEKRGGRSTSYVLPVLTFSHNPALAHASMHIP